MRMSAFPVNYDVATTAAHMHIECSDVMWCVVIVSFAEA